MNNKTKLFTAAVVFATLFFSACKKEDRTNNAANPSITGTWNFDGGTYDGYTVSKNASANIVNFRSDNQLERNFGFSYSTSCTGAPGPCVIAVRHFDFNDTIPYSVSGSIVTIETDPWESTVTSTTLILKIPSLGDSLHFSK